MESGNHGQHHEYQHHHFEEAEAFGGVFFLNLTFTLIGIAAGLWTNSVVILADSLHDAGDLRALGLAWYFQKAS